MTDQPRVQDPNPGGLFLGPDVELDVPAGGGQMVDRAVPADSSELTYEYGLEIEARSQWGYARKRFFRHRLALVSVIVLAVIFGAGIFANYIAPYSYKEIPYVTIAGTSVIDTSQILAHPSRQHLFGTDSAGRDTFSRTLYGIRTSARVGIFVGLLSTLIGTIIGGLAGFYGGWSDNLLMRMTDLFLTLPLLAVLLTASKFLDSSTPTTLAILIACLIWTSIARIVRGVFLSLREKEYVEAARAAGAGDLRIMLRHMIPNSVGPIVVAATLTIGTAIALEATLSFLGFGIRPPTPALGALLDEGQEAGLDKWWLVTYPGLLIVIIILCINFIGDGLRDALDPTQRRVRA
ncbi:MAG TPA: ABC transporter permease [Gaiellaceae bacterium]|nr:ABC transporter permease [Gaiellaceae bacterium]